MQNTYTKVVIDPSCIWYERYVNILEKKNPNVKLSNPIKIICYQIHTVCNNKLTEYFFDQYYLLL
jgi:hypothetical protein